MRGREVSKETKSSGGGGGRTVRRREGEVHGEGKDGERSMGMEEVTRALSGFSIQKCKQEHNWQCGLDTVGK